jgi:hypothetical protein
MLRRVALVRTDISEELNASIIRVTWIGEVGTTLAITSNRSLQERRLLQEPHGVKSQKTPFFIHGDITDCVTTTAQISARLQTNTRLRVTVTILGIFNRPTLCLHVQVEPTQTGPIQRSGPSPTTFRPLNSVSGDRLAQSIWYIWYLSMLHMKTELESSLLMVEISNKRQDDG